MLIARTLTPPILGVSSSGAWDGPRWLPWRLSAVVGVGAAGEVEVDAVGSGLLDVAGSEPEAELPGGSTQKHAALVSTTFRPSKSAQKGAACAGARTSKVTTIGLEHMEVTTGLVTSSTSGRSGTGPPHAHWQIR